MKSVYNPCEFKVSMKKVQNGENTYFIGNSDMKMDLQDTVLMFYPPKEGERYGALIIKDCKDRPAPMHSENSKGGDDDRNDE